MDSEELIKRLRNANSDFGIDDDLTKETADEIEELQHALDCMTTTAGELQDRWNYLDAASKASEKLHQIAMAEKTATIEKLEAEVKRLKDYFGVEDSSTKGER